MPFLGTHKAIGHLLPSMAGKTLAPKDASILISETCEQEPYLTKGTLRMRVQSMKWEGDHPSGSSGIGGVLSQEGEEQMPQWDSIALKMEEHKPRNKLGTP